MQNIAFNKNLFNEIMATEQQQILKQDGYLDLGLAAAINDDDRSGVVVTSGRNKNSLAGGVTLESRHIVYHPLLNVILAFDTNNQVKILDVHSGVVLQTYQLGGNANEKVIWGRYMPLQEKVLFWDSHLLGFRGDYNGVLLLDTILQAPIMQNDDIIKLELLLSEAIIFQSCLKDLEQEGLECPSDVSNELLEKIKQAQCNPKKGIKAQRWTTICLEVLYSSLKLVASNVVTMLKRLERHIPVLAIASAINERLTDLLSSSRISDITLHSVGFQRALMHSEAVRRQTFEKWPHMDYKWALPDQMAQAGFYHQPSTSGEDRAMCFTCSVCLVCWEKTDEPWSEHERHSPMCPFVKGEYTQNVPLSLTFATNPAVPVPGLGFDVISNSEYSNVLCTSCTQTGDLTIWSIERHLKKMYTLNIATLMKDICDEGYEWARITAICVLPNDRAQSKIASMQASQTGNPVNMSSGVPQCTSTSTLRAGVVGSKIVLGMSIGQSTGEHLLRMVVLNVVESDRNIEDVVDPTAEVVISDNGQSTALNVSTVGVGGGNTDSAKYVVSLDFNSQNQQEHMDNGVGNGTKNAICDDYHDLATSVSSTLGKIQFNSIEELMKFQQALELAAKQGVPKQFNDLGHVLSIADGNSVADFSLYSNTNGIEFEAGYIKEKLLEAAALAKQNKNNNNNNTNTNVNATDNVMNANNNMNSNNNNNTNSNNNNNNEEQVMSKIIVSEEIDCVVESCTSVKRMNALAAASCNAATEFVEIAEILPTNGECTQLLVKLQKTKVPNESQSQIIMATIEDEEDSMHECSNMHSDAVAAQLLLFDVVDSVISSEYTLAVTFSHAKCPKQLCMLPPLILQTDRRNSDTTIRNAFESGAICVVCADGTIEIYSLVDSSLITTIAEENEKFVSVAYCRSLDRLCGCTKTGGLLFYALNEPDNDSGDEDAAEMEEDVNTSTTIAQINAEVSVTDGLINNALNSDAGGNNSLESNSPRNLPPKTKAECMTAAAAAANTGSAAQGNASLSPSTSSSHTSTAVQLLAFKQEPFDLEDLRALYALTKFDPKLTPYTAEVPSCWNDLGQAQKQRKQPPNLRHGDDAQFSKTWRLHNDTTTWDEHIIELNLSQQVNLGHIDLKFSVYQQCHNPAGIQVTLLKQNTSGFGYRMKGPHASYKSAAVDQNMDVTYSTSENPVLNEEYLQTHNAEILAGPIELSSCIDLYDHGGTATLTSPKLFKTRTRNFLLHIKTVTDPSKEAQGKTRGCDWLHEISINVRCVKANNRIPNERLQRIAMLESNLIIQNLFKLASCDSTTKLERNLGLDVLIWICFIRLNRYRSPKSERIKDQINRTTAAQNNDLLSQQFECICLTEKYLEGLIRNCIIRGDRSMAHKCVKLMLLLTDGICNLPAEVQAHSTLYVSVMNALAKTFYELPRAKYASVVRWYVVLICAVSTVNTHQEIANLCIQMLYDVTLEIRNRWDPLCALLSTRFGLYGFPFEPEIFDFDLPNMSKSAASSTTSLLNVLRPKPALMQSAGLDINKLSSIDGVDFRTFPHLIKCKSISNQLRGLLEVEQLHFTCIATSEATRIDTLDTAAQTNAVNTATNVTIDDLYMGPINSNSVDPKDQMSVKQLNVIIDNMKLMKASQIDITEEALKANGVGPMDLTTTAPLSGMGTTTSIPKSHESKDFLKFDLGPILPKFKAICEFIESSDENKSANYNNKLTILPTADELDELCVDDDDNVSNKAHQYLDNQKEQEEYQQRQQEQIIAGAAEASCNALPGSSNTTFAWHKLLTPPPKQMIVIDRIHSGARRFVVLDFGSPILLTDLVIPACDELASLFIDIWCFDEEMDSQRLVAAPDICTKSLVLSDLQPPPICRYMKITIIGRIGMSSTKCKIPIGCFYGHFVVMEHDGYGDQFFYYLKQSMKNVQTQLRALSSLYEDVNCRYSLASCKLMEVLSPLLNSELSNTAHMQAFINKQREDETNSSSENNRIVNLYEECIMLQHQVNVIRNVIQRLEYFVMPEKQIPDDATDCTLQSASRDKLRVISLSLIEILLHFSIEYGIKNILPLHDMFDKNLANLLFNSLVVHGDAHIQLATCSLLVRMCCFQSWWGDFLADLFCNLFSSQNSKIFPQDRIFFLLTYLGRRSIAMGTCRSIVIDAILKTLAKLLAPLSTRCQNEMGVDMNGSHDELWAKSDVQLITWLLLFLSVCLDDNTDRKDKGSSRWDFMSCETDFSKTRAQCANSAGKQLRCFKKRIIQQKQFSVPPYTDWSKKIFMIQNEHPGIFMELKASNSSKSNKSSSKSNLLPKPSSSTSANAKEANIEFESNFDKGLKAIRHNNILIVIRGLIAFLLEMDFNCNMDQFLLTCKVIARLVSACRPVVQLSKIITTAQLEQLVRLSVWNDQQQPWAVHAITCLLQDLLDADKHFKDSDATPTNECIPPIAVSDKLIENSYHFSTYMTPNMNSALQASTNDMQYADGVKYSYLPSLIEYDDTEFDEILSDMELIDRSTPLTKKDSSSAAFSKSTFNYFCKSISRAMDARLEIGLELNVETQLRRMTNEAALDMYSSLPQILTNEFVTTPPEPTYWPDYITDIWSGPEYNSGLSTYKMFKNVFDCIFADLHLEDTWVHLEQVLHMWLTLNGELSDKMFGEDVAPQMETPKIPFGANAVQGLLLALAWHNDIKLRTWCLGFQCLYLACNTQNSAPTSDEEADSTRINEVIINDENFEKMLLRFFSGYGLSSSIVTNRCAGPTICRHLHELLLLLYKKSDTADGVLSCKRKLKDTLLHVVLQLVQPTGAINNLHGPIDAQSQMIRDLFFMPTDKADLNVALNIIESVSFLVYNNISNGDKLHCQRTSDTNASSNSFTNLFANVLGSENSKQNTALSDNSLLISLLKLATTLVQTELPRQPSEVPIPEEEELTNESQTDETKAEQLNNEAHRVKNACIADAVLRHFPTMKRLLGALSHCCSSSFSIMASSSLYTVKLVESSFIFDEPQTVPDAVFNMLITLNEKASHPRLIVAPICQYLETTTQQRNSLPRLQLSEPFLWYISKVLEASSAVQIFTQLGGIQIICQNLVKLNRTLINMQPGLISLVMQHMTKNTKCKLSAPICSTSNGKKSSSAAAQAQRNYHDGLINFAPFCTITSENETAQPAEVLIMNPVAAHRRQRTPAWSYMFYPNESHVDLTIVLPTAIMLKEVQLQPHTPTLASCPSAVALEISRDYGIAPIPVGPAMATTGLTCIRLKLVKPEIATIVVLRLYRPKDSSNIGLTHIAILGHTIFANNSSGHSVTSASSSSNSNSNALLSQHAFNQDHSADEDSFAKTSVGWIRILARCFNVPGMFLESKLATDVIGASAAYPGFLEACCSLMNILPLIPNSGLRKLDSIMMKLARYDLELSIKLIKILLWKTTPQVYKLSNDSICDLLYEMSTINDSHTMARVNVLLDWIVNLRHNYSNVTLRCCNNPQSGYVKVIASILWFVYTENYLCNLPQLISAEVFDACMYWFNMLTNEEPLKVAFDSLLCSLCCIKPELFNELLCLLNVRVVQAPVEEDTAREGVTPAAQAQTASNSEQDDMAGIQTHDSELTDDKKCAGGSEWFAKVAKGNLSTLLSRPSYLTTLAMAAQSPLAIYQLVDSGLPKLLAHALYEFCCTASPDVKRVLLFNAISDEDVEIEQDQQLFSAASDETAANSSATTTATDANCMTDADKVGKCRLTGATKRDVVSNFTLSYTHVPKILDFFATCCAEGHMRDWLGTQQGSIFWRPLLEFLCNYRPKTYTTTEPMQMAFIRMERSTINFFTRVCACHPKNQDTLTAMLIAVIRKPELVLPMDTMNDETSSCSSASASIGNSSCSTSSKNSERATISGFTRQLVLQLLLENERILVSVRSKKPLKRRDLSPTSSNVNSFGLCSSSPSSSVQMCLVTNHPAKRISAHHLLFSVSTNSTMRDILQQCASETRAQESTTMSSSNLDSLSANAQQQPLKMQQTNEKSLGMDTPYGVLNIYGNSSGGGVSNASNIGSNCMAGLNLNGIENGMEFLSVAAGVTAKDKRLKDVKNQVTANKESSFPHFKSKFFQFDEVFTPTNSGSLMDSAQFVHSECPHVTLAGGATVAQLLAVLHNKGLSLSTPCITLDLVRIESTQTTSSSSTSTSTTIPDDTDDILSNAICVEPLLSPLERFSSRGGLALLAKYLPTVYPECTIRKPISLLPEKEKSPPMTDWVKLEPNDDIYEDLEDPITEPIAKNANITAVPQHSLAAFGLFLRLPAYSDVLLRDKYRAQCLLRLVLGVTGDGEGNDIYNLPLATTLPTLPFEVFRQLLDSAPLTTDDGMLLRRMVIDVGAMYLVLNCLSVFTHQTKSYLGASATPQNEPSTGSAAGGGSGVSAGVTSTGSNMKVNTTANTGEEHANVPVSDDKSHVYWAKGTGFGTGSTTQSWNVEQALMRQKSEEEHVTVLLQVLSSYINPSDRIPSSMQDEEILPYHEIYDGVPNELPVQFLNLLQQSCLISALSSYLRNDSVLDITRHIPLYRAILQLLRALSLSQQLVTLLQPTGDHTEKSPSIAELLINMKTCVDTYAKRLKINKKSNLKGQTQQVTVNLDDGDDEGLALLIPDIQETTLLVQKTTNADALRQQKRMEEDGILCVGGMERLPPSCKSIEERYLEVMKKLQFDTYDMIVEADNNGYRFTISHHFEKMVRMAGDRFHPSRVKRLAQEAVTLSTSLPLSYSSSVFVRCDTDRLDVMKVLITGPADTPYANGCFEFDVYFPPDYPNLPMMINLETTGRHSVRFNPNLYNDGKVCLSVLNTWHGRPEEKWNAQTSSFLQVLVSIQSLILVPEPYFNEPGFERSRGTPSGTHSSREYNTNIYQACVRWAMLEQIRNPSPCFKDIIHTHFWLKRHEICEQIESWIEELSKPQYSERNSRTISFNSMVLRRQYRHLREELAKLKVPEGLEDLDAPFNPQTTLPAMTETAVGTATPAAVAGTENGPATTGSTTAAPVATLTIAATQTTAPAIEAAAATTTTTEIHSAMTTINSGSTATTLPDVVNIEAMLLPDVQMPVIAKVATVESSDEQHVATVATTVATSDNSMGMGDMMLQSDQQKHKKQQQPMQTTVSATTAKLPPPPGFDVLPTEDINGDFAALMQLIDNDNVLPEGCSDEMDTSSYDEI